MPPSAALNLNLTITKKVDKSCGDLARITSQIWDWVSLP